MKEFYFKWYTTDIKGLIGLEKAKTNEHASKEQSKKTAVQIMLLLANGLDREVLDTVKELLAEYDQCIQKKDRAKGVAFLEKLKRLADL